MIIVTKQPSWKHVTFKTPKINFENWAKQGIKIILSDSEQYEFKDKDALHALNISINPSYNNNDSCYIEINAIRSIYHKTKRKEKIQLLNGDIYDKEELLNKMYDDSFYYGELGKYALSSSSIKYLLDSPKAYARSLNFKSDSNVFKAGRLIHLAALEPEKIDTLCHIVEVQSAVTKKYKDKVKEIGSDQFVFTRKEYDKAMYTVDALLQNELWQDITRKAKFEQPGFDILHGFPFRAKADILGDGFISDLKTTSDLKAFPYSAKKYSYDVQVYIYCNIFNIHWKDFNFFVIDKSSGDLGIYDVSQSFYDSGMIKLEKAIDIYKDFFVDKNQELNNYVIKGTLE